ncbi:MAG: NAD(P)/FAD-dependent oxidoreductase [Paracoccaceae bacterium]
MAYDTIILGAGAAGLMAAIHASARGGKVLVLDHARAPGEKIRISGGGRCNFTNLHAGPGNFISQNKHFAKSCLARYTQWDFIDLMVKHKIAYHEKTLGQLFCDGSAKQVVAMLLAEAARAEIRLETSIDSISHDGTHFNLRSSAGRFTARNLVVATGGKSIPKMGATGFAYQIAEQFNHALIAPRPGLVPLTFAEQELAWIKPLAGTALPVSARVGATSFDEAMLFTHRGLSGPAILQISSYWVEGDEISLDLMPKRDLAAMLRDKRAENGRRSIGKALGELLPSRLAAHFTESLALSGNIADWSDKRLTELAERLQNWRLTPTSSEGYRTAEVTIGGIDTDGLNSSDMQSKTVPGLYFIGEAVDVTGWLGGFNFQWAWSSGWAAGTAIAAQS